MRLIKLTTVVALLTFAQAIWAQAIILDPMLSETELKQMSPHVHVIVGFPAIEIIVGDKATLVVDSGVGPRNGAFITKVARKLSTHGQRLFMTTTQYHADRTSGQSGFPPETIVVRNQAQQAELEALGPHELAEFADSPQRKALLKGVTVGRADVLFDHELELDLGGVHARLLYFGPGHTEGDEIVFVPEDSVLIPGDVVQNKITPNPLCGKCSPRQHLAVLDQILPLQPKVVIPSHGAFGGPELITQERAILLDIETRATALKAQGKTATEAGKIISAEFAGKYSGWLMLGEQVPRAVQHAYADQP